MSGDSLASQRIDKWLWHARFARTRGAAQDLVVAGHVRVNREKARTPSKTVRVGDILTLALGRGVVVLQVAGVAERRLSPDKAAALYRMEAAPSPFGQGAEPEGPPSPTGGKLE